MRGFVGSVAVILLLFMIGLADLRLTKLECKAGIEVGPHLMNHFALFIFGDVVECNQ